MLPLFSEGTIPIGCGPARRALARSFHGCNVAAWSGTQLDGANLATTDLRRVTGLSVAQVCLARWVAGRIARYGFASGSAVAMRDSRRQPRNVGAANESAPAGVANAASTPAEPCKTAPARNGQLCSRLLAPGKMRSRGISRQSRPSRDCRSVKAEGKNFYSS